MQSGLRWGRSLSRRRFPVVGTPYAPPSARPCGCRGTMAFVRRCALCGRSVACGQLCGVCSRPPLCFAAARHQHCALVCPSAPRGGSLSPRGSDWPQLAIFFVADYLINTGLTGQNGLNPHRYFVQWGQFDKLAPQRRKDLAPIEAKSLIHLVGVKPL
jgi:hypothetical protein